MVGESLEASIKKIRDVQRASLGHPHKRKLQKREKNNPEIFLSPMEKIYHIYARGSCIYHSLKEEEFKTTWRALNRLADLLTDSAELSYEELVVNKEMSHNSSY